MCSSDLHFKTLSSTVWYSSVVEDLILLCTELLKTSEHQSTLDIDVEGAEFSRNAEELYVLQQSLKGLGFNLCVALHCNG